MIVTKTKKRHFYAIELAYRGWYELCGSRCHVVRFTSIAQRDRWVKARPTKRWEVGFRCEVGGVAYVRDVAERRNIAVRNAISY